MKPNDLFARFGVDTWEEYYAAVRAAQEAEGAVQPRAAGAAPTSDAPAATLQTPTPRPPAV
eukprot:13477139-Alexandrium_andersonii.AAC.1